MKGMNKGFLLVATGVIAVAVAAGTLGSPQPDSLYLDVKRDVFSEYATALAAVEGTEGPLNPRTPAATLTNLPILAAPNGWLVWTSIVVNAASAMLLVGALFKFTGNETARLIAALGVPLTLMFAQTAAHTNLFVMYAAALVWGWYHIENKSYLFAGILVGLVGAVRLWPLALIALFVMWRNWKLVWSTLGTVIGLNLAGLLLPGVSLAGSWANLTGGANEWVGSKWNGSIAGSIDGLTPHAVIIGFVVGVTVWALGVRRFTAVRGQVGWTLTAAMFASPLLWVGYILVLTPLFLTRRWVWVATMFFVPSPIVIGVAAVLGFVCWYHPEIMEAEPHSNRQLGSPTDPRYPRMGRGHGPRDRTPEHLPFDA